MAEILAPAGSLENVYAAIDAGADAIYLGGKQFNARKFAHNLDDEELQKAVKTAHLFGVRIYVTVNILMADTELQELTGYLKKLDAMQVDGIIVQDLAVASLARTVAPTLPLHGSTQQTVADINGVRFLENLGFTQVVLSRELSLKEIKEICAQANAKIEVFIHGAECVCYSGQCLMSSFIGGRSGNRGACAQPCRMGYTLLAGKETVSRDEVYLLSLKDLNSLELMSELVAAGVSSFKIEGRMKGSGYVRTVVDAYRQVIDAHGVQEQQRALAEGQTILADSFNRGYQADFLRDTVGRQTITETASGNRGRQAGLLYKFQENIAHAFLDEPLELGDMVKIIDKTGQECIDELRSVTAGGMKNGKQEYILEFRRSDLLQGTIFRLSRRGDREGGDRGLVCQIPLYFHIDVNSEGYLRLTVWDETGHTAEITSDYLAKKAIKRPADQAWVKQQLDRLGDTVFSVTAVTLWDETYMIPASVLNGLRRDAVQTMESALLAEYQRPASTLKNGDQRCVSVGTTAKPMSAKKLSLAVRCDTLDGLTAAVDAGADRVIYGGESYDHRTFTAKEWQQAVAIAHRKNIQIWAATPRILRQRHVKITRNELLAACRAGIDGLYAGALGIFDIVKDTSISVPVYADWSLNIFNYQAAQVFAETGCTGLTLSPEMTLRQIRFMAKQSPMPLEVLVQGRLEMMVMENCPISSFAGKGSKRNCVGLCVNKTYALKDRKDELFPIVTDQFCRTHILNSRDLDMAPYFNDLKDSGLAGVRIEARGRRINWIEQQTARYRRLCDGTETMLLNREDSTVTRGHFFHGII